MRFNAFTNAIGIFATAGFSQSLSGLPDCAMAAFLNSPAYSSCSDMSCYCSNAGFMTAMQSSVQANCSPDDQTKALGVAQQMCTTMTSIPTFGPTATTTTSMISPTTTATTATTSVTSSTTSGAPTLTSTTTTVPPTITSTTTNQGIYTNTDDGATTIYPTLTPSGNGTGNATTSYKFSGTVTPSTTSKSLPSSGADAESPVLGKERVAVMALAMGVMALVFAEL